jgi:predicted outer membrane repeat protein
VNDATAEEEFAAGNDENDGLSAERPMASVQTLLDRYPDIGEGTTIQLSAGVFRPLSIKNGHAGLEIRGAGPNLTVIDGAQQGSCIVIEYWSGGVLSDLALANGRSQRGGGISCVGSSGLVRNCFFQNNHASFGGGGYFDRRGRARKDARWRLEDCSFYGNTCVAAGGAVQVSGEVSLYQCSLEMNRSERGSAGAIDARGEKVSIERCRFFRNRTEGNNGGAISSNSSVLEITECEFLENSAGANGGAINSYGKTLYLVECRFVANATTNNGGALFAHTDENRVERCSFDSNSALRGGAAYVSNNAIFADCSFTQNSARRGGVLQAYSQGTAVVLQNCTFSANAEPVFDGPQEAIIIE